MGAGWQAAGLLVLSNLFMTTAWYGHLRYKSTALWLVILVSWGIAFFEYCLQVPANRIGSGVMTAPQLKGLQEVISILVFAAFSTVVLGQAITPRQWAGFALVVVAAYLIVGD
ncbi:MAG: DMT family protein [Janthinobacterium lividum]